MPLPSERGGSALPHMAQLDALRAFAALGVLFAHFSPQIRHLAPLHHMGVRLFFVLSGFLITGILLRCREVAETQGLGTWAVMKQFYARRFLRIFPLFYFTLIVAVAAGLDHARENAVWLLTYTVNFKMAITGQHIGPLTAYWTLAVEEQFYLVWPWVIMLVPKRWLLPAVLLTIALGPAWRSMGVALGFNDHAVAQVPLGCMDTLGMGALLALASSRWAMPGLRDRVVRVGLWVGLPLVLAMQAMVSLAFFATKGLRDALHDSAMALFFTWLVAGAAVGFTGLAARVLTWRPLLYVGTISYGVYVYHNYLWFIPHEKVNAALAPGMAGSLNRWFAGEGLGLLIPRVLVTIAVAALSWKFFEKPLNDLKRHFEYDKAKGPQKAERRQAALVAS